MGPYDDERGVHLESDDWRDGQWLAAEDGALYVIPVNGDDVEGPDDDVAAAILAHLRRTGAEGIDGMLAAELGLTIVADHLKRFDADSGYYAA